MTEGWLRRSLRERKIPISYAEEDFVNSDIDEYDPVKHEPEVDDDGDYDEHVKIKTTRPAKRIKVSPKICAPTPRRKTYNELHGIVVYDHNDGYNDPGFGTHPREPMSSYLGRLLNNRLAQEAAEEQRRKEQDERWFEEAVAREMRRLEEEMGDKDKLSGAEEKTSSNGNSKISLDVQPISEAQQIRQDWERLGSSTNDHGYVCSAPETRLSHQSKNLVPAPTQQSHVPQLVHQTTFSSQIELQNSFPTAPTQAPLITSQQPQVAFLPAASLLTSNDQRQKDISGITSGNPKLVRKYDGNKWICPFQACPDLRNRLYNSFRSRFWGIQHLQNNHNMTLEEAEKKLITVEQSQHRAAAHPSMGDTVPHLQYTPGLHGQGKLAQSPAFKVSAIPPQMTATSLWQDDILAQGNSKLYTGVAAAVTNTTQPVQNGNVPNFSSYRTPAAVMMPAQPGAYVASTGVNSNTQQRQGVTLANPQVLVGAKPSAFSDSESTAATARAEQMSASFASRLQAQKAAIQRAYTPVVGPNNTVKQDQNNSAQFSAMPILKSLNDGHAQQTTPISPSPYVVGSPSSTGQSQYSCAIEQRLLSAVSSSDLTSDGQYSGGLQQASAVGIGSSQYDQAQQAGSEDASASRQRKSTRHPGIAASIMYNVLKEYKTTAGAKVSLGEQLTWDLKQQDGYRAQDPSELQSKSTSQIESSRGYDESKTVKQSFQDLQDRVPAPSYGGTVPSRLSSFHLVVHHQPPTDTAQPDGQNSVRQGQPFFEGGPGLLPTSEDQVKLARARVLSERFAAYTDAEFLAVRPERLNRECYDAYLVDQQRRRQGKPEKK